MEKSMAEHLSSTVGRFYWDNISNDDHVAVLFKMEVNDHNILVPRQSMLNIILKYDFPKLEE